MINRQLEVWADSFKEGEWFLDGLATQFRGIVQKSYRYNFQPIYEFAGADNRGFMASVFGDYRGWEPLPGVIGQILDYGKPDIILYDRAADLVFFAVEETAAVPTGNQSLQRLERVHFAAAQRIPFIYLVSEYGLHIDGGVRRTSIWPSYLALKLSSQYQVPSLTLLYGDVTHPGDYLIGTGVADLISLSSLYISEWLGEDVEEEKKRLLARIFLEMGNFILSQVAEISPQMPGQQLLTSRDFLDFIALRTAKYEA